MQFKECKEQTIIEKQQWIRQCIWYFRIYRIRNLTNLFDTQFTELKIANSEEWITYANNAYQQYLSLKPHSKEKIKDSNDYQQVFATHIHHLDLLRTKYINYEAIRKLANYYFKNEHLKKRISEEYVRALTLGLTIFLIKEYKRLEDITIFFKKAHTIQFLDDLQLFETIFKAPNIEIKTKKNHQPIAESHIVDHIGIITELKQQLFEKTQKIQQLKHRLNYKEQQLLEKDKALAQLQSIKQKFQELEYENQQLRNCINNQSNQKLHAITHQTPLAIPETTYDKAQLIRFLNQPSIAIVGGYGNWLKKIKQLLPHTRYFEPERVGQPFEGLKNCQLIIFHSAINQHSNFRHVKTIVQQHQIPLIYMSTQASNVDVFLKNIHDACVKQQLNYHN